MNLIIIIAKRICTHLLLFAVLIPDSALSHEFWLEPDRYHSAVNEPITLELRNGEHFSGSLVPFTPELTTGFTLHHKINSNPVSTSAYKSDTTLLTLHNTGLNIVAYEQMPRVHRYLSFDQFTTFLDEDGLDWVLSEHRDRGFPETNITEQYRRYAKTLIHADNWQGKDQKVGLELELVLLSTFATGDVTEIRVQLLYRGSPLPDIQVSLFEKERSRIAISRTDAKGTTTISVEPGKTYLLSAVHMRMLDAESMFKTSAFWESLWTSTSFQVGGLEAKDFESQK